MVGIEKAYFALEEVEERWDMPRRDIAYLAENGMLKVSVRFFGLQIERGSYEETADGQCFRIPEERTTFRGLLDLLPGDAHQVFQQGVVTAQEFGAPGGQYCSVLQPHDGVVVKRDVLVIRREERDRIEKSQGFAAQSALRGTGFVSGNDRTAVAPDATALRFGPIQANVVRILTEAAATSSPWLPGKQVLAQAGSSCTRMADLFKAKPGWRDLIASDGRGNYRLVDGAA